MSENELLKGGIIFNLTKSNAFISIVSEISENLSYEQFKPFKISQTTEESALREIYFESTSLISKSRALIKLSKDFPLSYQMTDHHTLG